MSNVFIGIDGKARHVKTVYVGVNGIARKVTKGYIGVDGIARQFYTSRLPFAYEYSGNSVESDITVDGVEYTLLTLTSSGTLTVSKEIPVEVWLCGGGGNGGSIQSTANGQVDGSQSGGGGAGAFASSGNMTLSGSMAATVASRGGRSSFGTISADAGGSAETISLASATDAHGGADGGTGGGSGRRYYSSYWWNYGGRGDGVSKCPFGDSSNMKVHCGGGGGGGNYILYDLYADGHDGGANGEWGYGIGTDGDRVIGTGAGGAGGNRGGGTGGSAAGGSAASGGSATFYGSGGGGASHHAFAGGVAVSGGAGYQGVIYIRWKKEDVA